MTKIRMVHVSDIHFGQEVDGTLVEQTDIRQAVVRDCQIMRARLGEATGLIVTGDVAFSGKKAEYDRAGVWLDELCDTVRCPKPAVHTIPGNHDIDLVKIDFMVELLHKSLRDCHPDAVNETLSKIYGTDPNIVTPSATALYAKLAAYREFAARYQSDFESETRPVAVKELRFSTGHILRFIGLTSVQVSDKTDAAQKMILGSSQYIITSEQNVEYVVMCHHPFNWFKDYASARPYLITRGRLLLTGHEHQPAFRRIEESGHQYLMLDAGATTPPGSEQKSPYCYNWIEFELHEDSGGFHLDVRVYPRAWNAARADFGADRTRIGDSESELFSVKCPNYSVAEAPLLAADPPIPVGVTSQETAAMPDDERFAKLLYFFWRYLDWQQRYSVLAKVDVLPKGLDRPMPQVLERNALDTAKTKNKLSSVWDEVMKFVPDAERQQNPYYDRRS